MASRLEIKCIKKTNRSDPHDRIHAIGGQNSDGTPWQLTQQQAIEGIEGHKWAFYVQVNGHLVNVIVAVSRFGHKYIKTVADGEHPNNLLSLMECRY
jgi:hypothetical protein